jgi:hypothetical protein
MLVIGNRFLFKVSSIFYLLSSYILYLLIGDSQRASTLILEINNYCPLDALMICLLPLDGIRFAVSTRERTLLFPSTSLTEKKLITVCS